MRVEKQMKCDKRKSNDRTALLLKADRRSIASRSASDLKADYRSTALKNRPEPRDASFDVPQGRFVTNAGDCFFLFIEQAYWDIVFSQRRTLALTTTEADLDRYRGLRQSEEASESAESEHDAIGHLAGMRLCRARSSIADLEFCRSAIDVLRLREEVDKRSYWADAISIGGSIYR